MRVIEVCLSDIQHDTLVRIARGRGITLRSAINSAISAGLNPPSEEPEGSSPEAAAADAQNAADDPIHPAVARELEHEVIARLAGLPTADRR